MGVFGSVQVGSGARFSSKNQPAVDPFQPDVTDVQLRTPPAPLAYQKLQHGPDFQVEFERHLTPPLDGSKDLLRALSPFMIQVEPPLVYGKELVQHQPNDFAGVLAAARRNAPAAFQSARQRIQNDIPGGPQLSNARSVEAFVAGGVAHRAIGADQLNIKQEGDVSSHSGRIGEPAITDLYTAADITMQLRGILDTPPLILLINPQTLTLSFNKSQQYSDRTRFGFLFQAWGEEQPTLSVSARCGAFVSGGRGVQWASRRDSASWNNLANAFRFYRHNGYIYDTVGKSNAHHFVGALSIHYDGWIYYGNMESFSYGFDEGSQQGGVNFEMSFIVNAMADSGRQNRVVTPMRSPIPTVTDPRLQRQGPPSVGSLVESTRDLPQPDPEQGSAFRAPQTASASTGLFSPAAGAVNPFGFGG